MFTGDLWASFRGELARDSFRNHDALTDFNIIGCVLIHCHHNISRCSTCLFLTHLIWASEMTPTVGEAPHSLYKEMLQSLLEHSCLTLRSLRPCHRKWYRGSWCGGGGGGLLPRGSSLGPVIFGGGSQKKGFYFF